MVAISGRFVDRCVIVLGGAEGVGLAAAVIFADEGAKIAVTGCDPQALRAAAEDLDALAIGCDLGDPQGAQGAMDEIEEALGGIDVLIVPESAICAIESALPLIRDGGNIVITTLETTPVLRKQAGQWARDLLPRRIRVNLAPKGRKTTEDFAQALVFLASPAACFINGVEFQDDGACRPLI